MTDINKKVNKLRKEQEFFKEIILKEAEKTNASISLQDHNLTIEYDPDWEKKHKSEILMEISSCLVKGVRGLVFDNRCVTSDYIEFTV